MPIIRDTAGLLARHVASESGAEFATGDWTAPSGVTLSLSSGNLQMDVSTGSANAGLEYTAIASRSEVYVQSVVRSITGTAVRWIGSAVHINDLDPAAQDLVYLRTSLNRSPELLQLREVVGGASGATDSDSVASKAIGTFYRLAQYANGSAVSGYDFTASASRSITTASFTAGKVGFHTSGNNTFQIQRFYACTRNTISVSDLTSGQKAKVRDSGGTVLATATESAGTAVVNVQAVAVEDIADLVVTDSSDTILDTYDATGVFPGDEYSYSAGTTVTPGAASLTITGLAPTVVATTDPVCEFGFPPGMPADYRARIDYAVTDSNVAPPAEDSPVWLTAGALLAEGTLATPPLSAGAYVWIRARGEAAARRPSVWTVPIVVQVPSVATLSAATIFLSGAVPNVGWTAGTFTLGVRIRYSLGSPGHVPSWTLEGDVPAADGNYTFPATNVAEGQEIRVELTPYTGFGGGSVSGEAGAPTVLQVARVTEDTPAITFVSAARTLAGDCDLVPMTHRVAWNVDGDFTGFEVTIEASEDGGAFVELANSLGASGTYDDEIAGVQHDADAVAVAYVYRVALVRTAGASTLASEDTPTLNSRPVACGS